MKGTCDIARDNMLQQLGKAQAGLLPRQLWGGGDLSVPRLNLGKGGRVCTGHDFIASSTLRLHQQQTSTMNFS